MTACFPTMRFKSLGLSLAMLGAGGVAFSEVVFDGTLGPVGSFSGDFEISDAFGTQLGANLFHSFETFNVNTGESATFTSAFMGVTDHVIGRVTGGNLTTIDGLVTSTIPGADLWLVNPAGLVIGDNASLDVLGGLHLSTADYLLLEDGGRFYATELGNTQLTVAGPAAFGFIDADIGTVDFGATSLNVAEGQAWSVVGGDITLSGSTLWAQAGSVGIASVASAGVVDLNDPEGTRGSFTAFGDVTLDQAWVTANGEQGGSIYIVGGEFVAMESTIDSETWGSGQGRDIRIDVDSMTTFDVDSVTEGFTTIEAETYADGNAGSVEINVSGALATGEAARSTGSQIRNIAWNDSTGNAGSITINAADVSHQFSTIGIFTLGTGIGGRLSVNATNSIYVQGGFGTTFANNSIATATAGDVVLSTPDLEFVGGSILARAIGDGDGGSLFINAENMTMSGGAQFSVSSFGLGDGGAIQVEVTDTITLTDDVGYPTGMFGAASGGQGGDVNVHSRILNIRDGAQLSDSIFAGGQAGNVNVIADEGIFIAGAPDLDTGIFANTFATGQAGNLSVTAPVLELTQGGSIAVATFEEIGGDAGSIFIDVEDLVIEGQNSFVSARSFGSGDGGDINIGAAGGISIAGDPGLEFTGIFAGADAGGNGGNILINTPTLSIADAGLVQASTFGDGDAGTITINASESITIDSVADADTGIFNDTFGAGRAGSINLSAPSIDVSGLGLIQAGSSILGDAGEISISVDNLSVTAGGSIRVQTQGAGTAGELSVSATDTVLVTGAGDDRPSSLSSETSGSGAGGTVAVAADRVVLDDQGLVTAATTAGGLGGDISIQGRQVHVTNDAAITANSAGTGNAGTVIVVAAEALNVDAQGAIRTNSESSAGGNIDLQVGHTLMLDDGSISAAAGGVTPGDAGGNVTIDPEFVILRNSDVLANANAGNGGNISIRAGTFVIDANSSIDASSTRGLDGDIAVDSPNEVTGNVIPLDTPAAPAPDLLAQRCVPQLESERSTLTADVNTRGLVAPGDFLPSPLANVGQVAADARSGADETTLARARSPASCFGAM